MENSLKAENKLESKERGPDAALEAAVDQLDAHATRLGREGSDVDISEETAERIEKKTSKIKNFLKAASMGLALYGGIKVGDDIKDYATSRYEITSAVGQDGKLEYEHEDPETTRILNFLTGARELAPEDKIHFYRELVRSEIKEKLQSQKRAETLSTLGSNDHELTRMAGALSLEELNAIESRLSVDEAGLKLLLREMYAEQDIVLGREVQDDINVRVDEAFTKAVEAGVDYDPVIEKLVWDMQKKVGAPRVRWAAPADNERARQVGHAKGTGRAFYSPSDNTVYITPGSNAKTLGRLLVTEDAHAVQYNNSPVTSRVRHMIDRVRTQIRARDEHKNYYDAQLAEYTMPGTIEHEAHEVIEKQLIDDFIEEGNRLKDIK